MTLEEFAEEFWRRVYDKTDVIMMLLLLMLLLAAVVGIVAAGLVIIGVL